MAVYLLLLIVWDASWDTVREQYEKYQGFKRIQCIENFVFLLLEKD
jgi:hypothetical protein